MILLARVISAEMSFVVFTAACASSRVTRFRGSAMDDTPITCRLYLRTFRPCCGLFCRPSYALVPRPEVQSCWATSGGTFEPRPPGSPGPHLSFLRSGRMLPGNGASGASQDHLQKHKLRAGRIRPALI